MLLRVVRVGHGDLLYPSMTIEGSKFCGRGREAGRTPRNSPAPRSSHLGRPSAQEASQHDRVVHQRPIVGGAMEGKGGQAVCPRDRQVDAARPERRKSRRSEEPHPHPLPQTGEGATRGDVLAQERHQPVEIARLPGPRESCNVAGGGPTPAGLPRDGLAATIEGAVDRRQGEAEGPGNLVGRPAQDVFHQQGRPLLRRHALQEGQEGEGDCLARLRHLRRVGEEPPVGRGRDEARRLDLPEVEVGQNRGRDRQAGRRAGATTGAAAAGPGRSGRCSSRWCRASVRGALPPGSWRAPSRLAPARPGRGPRPRRRTQHPIAVAQQRGPVLSEGRLEVNRHAANLPQASSTLRRFVPANQGSPEALGAC